MICKPVRGNIDRNIHPLLNMSAECVYKDIETVIEEMLYGDDISYEHYEYSSNLRREPY